MRSWDALTIAEQTLLRRAMSQYSLAGSVQHYGMALRWADAEGAPASRSYTEAEQLQLIPGLAAVAMDLAERGLITVQEVQGTFPVSSDTVLTDTERQEVLAEAANWLSKPGSPRRFDLSCPEAVRELWLNDAYPSADTGGLPTWDELSIAQREVLVCAAEASGMLTGPFGIWEELPAGLGGAERLAWVDQQLAPLVPFVRERWIEVQHHPDTQGDAFTVIPLDRLRSALADPAVRYEGDDWGIGVGCTFTYSGLAVWRGGWSRAWGSRLTFD
ncbi:hypothetical protein N4G70_27420 [Streptomyces sp. ASQP_92]|uniref:hypothetical protein n=1 Tax=Streptomyces sp. ASQP_92 TaxID=2979116 RepID=UPI0021C141A7|nr:hypothetical protein [Streptomyces sp. ASQP_92]MCT9092573.1 hypothetical protein [Streptomyces sp. ASQP_92]